MNIPKNKRHQKKKELTCQYPGCGSIFFGIAVSKYCLEHRQEKYRIRKPRELRPIEEENQIILHSFSIATEQIMTCDLEGCHQSYSITLLPKQKVYTKFCSDHRNEFRRGQFTKQYKQLQAKLIG